MQSTTDPTVTTAAAVAAEVAAAGPDPGAGGIGPDQGPRADGATDPDHDPTGQSLSLGNGKRRGQSPVTARPQGQSPVTARLRGLSHLTVGAAGPAVQIALMTELYHVQIDTDKSCCGM